MKLNHYLFTSILGTFALSACFELPPPQTKPPAKGNQDQTTTSSLCASTLLLQGIAPQINNPALSKNNQNLCFQEFALAHSGVSKGPLWVAEYLTPAKVAAQVKRQGEFHAEPRLPSAERAELGDYKGSGYDRGHMAPSGNMSSISAQQDSFSLANMVPQAPKNNQITWRLLEEATRSLVQNSQEAAYIVTGVAFLNAKVTTIGANRVLVPSHLYKAVYQPNTGVIGVYWVANTATAKPEIISVCALEAKTRVNVLPILSKSERRQRYDLPITSKQVPKNGQIAHLDRDAEEACSNKISSSDATKLAQSFP